MQRSSRPVGTFFVRTLLWLVPCLAVWFAARHWVALPPAWLAGNVAHAVFPFWVTGAELDGTRHTLLTTLAARSADGRLGNLSPEVDVLTYAYGTPLLAALLLAVRSRGLWWKIPLGALALVPFQAWGVLFAWLSQVVIVSGDMIRGQLRFDAWESNFIAAGYQFGFLLMPTLAPILLWLLLDHRLVTEVMLQGRLDTVGNGAAAAPPAADPGASPPFAAASPGSRVKDQKPAPPRAS